MGWKYLTLHEQRVISNISRPKGHAFQIPHRTIISSERGRAEDFLFLVSHESLERNRRLVPRNALSSLFLLFSLFFFLLSFFPFFKEKPHCAANGERDGKRGRRGKEETICGGAVARRRANTGQPDFTVSRKTPGSRPIPRSCSVMQVLSASAWILYRAYIYRTG